MTSAAAYMLHRSGKADADGCALVLAWGDSRGDALPPPFPAPPSPAPASGPAAPAPLPLVSPSPLPLLPPSLVWCSPRSILTSPPNHFWALSFDADSDDEDVVPPASPMVAGAAVVFSGSLPVGPSCSASSLVPKIQSP